jgi:erythromycin esterase
MRIRSIVAAALFLVTLAVDAGSRRRAVAKPISGDPTTVQGWLNQNAHVLTAQELVPYSDDLEPLRNMIGSAGVVGIGDGTHGTREFYTMKVRVIDFMARELGFDLLAFEAPFTVMNRVDAYAQGGPGSARELVLQLRALGYFFWDAEEFVNVVEWMRAYNAQRGEEPPLRIAGFDIFDPYGASREVIAYLRTVDPVAATSAEESYSCILESTRTLNGACAAAAESVHDALLPREAELSALSSAAAFQDALHHARVVKQSAHPSGTDRDDSLAANVLWLREHRGSSRKMILWAHNAHVSKAGNQWAFDPPMGKTLAAAIGNDYFAIATMTAAGTFRQLDRTGQHIVRTFPPLRENSIEAKFRERSAPRLMIPLRGALPSWLSGIVHYNSAAGSGDPGLDEVLAEHYDAAIFIDTTTALHAIIESPDE